MPPRLITRIQLRSSTSPAIAIIWNQAQTREVSTHARTHRKEETGGKSDCPCFSWTRACESLHQRYPCVFLRAGDLRFIQGEQGCRTRAETLLSSRADISSARPSGTSPSLKAGIQLGSGRATALGTAATSPGRSAAASCRLAPAALLAHHPGPNVHIGGRLPWGRAVWHRARRQGGPHGDSAPASLPRATAPSPPARPENAPEAAAAPLRLPVGFLPPAPTLWCLPGSPGLARPSPAALLDPALALAPLPPRSAVVDATTHGSGLGAGPLPTYLLPALIWEQPGRPGLAGPPEGGGRGGG